MEEIVLKDRKIRIDADGNSDLFLIQLSSREETSLKEKIAAERPFSFVQVFLSDWNRELSPWKAKGVFKGQDFSGEGEETLSFLKEELIPYLKERYHAETFVLGGYSLAGLFSLWVGYETELFEGIASCSGSLWFPEFDAYQKERRIHAEHVYLSLGDREHKARNPVMAAVKDKTEETYELLRKQGTDTVLEWNEGGHFNDPEGRTARGFGWILKRLS